MMQNVHCLLIYVYAICAIIGVERSVYKMKIVKLPIEYRRYLIEEKHVIYGDFEYWMLLRPSSGFGWRFGYMRKNIKTGDIEEVKIV